MGGRKMRRGMGSGKGNGERDWGGGREMAREDGDRVWGGGWGEGLGRVGEGDGVTEGGEGKGMRSRVRESDGEGMGRGTGRGMGRGAATVLSSSSGEGTCVWQGLSLFCRPQTRQQVHGVSQAVPCQTNPVGFMSHARNFAESFFSFSSSFSHFLLFF